MTMSDSVIVTSCRRRKSLKRNKERLGNSHWRISEMMLLILSISLRNVSLHSLRNDSSMSTEFTSRSFTSFVWLSWCTKVGKQEQVKTNTLMKLKNSRRLTMKRKCFYKTASITWLNSRNRYRTINLRKFKSKILRSTVVKSNLLRKTIRSSSARVRHSAECKYHLKLEFYGNPTLLTLTHTVRLIN